MKKVFIIFIALVFVQLNTCKEIPENPKDLKYDKKQARVVYKKLMEYSTKHEKEYLTILKTLKINISKLNKIEKSIKDLKMGELFKTRRIVYSFKGAKGEILETCGLRRKNLKDLNSMMTAESKNLQSFYRTSIELNNKKIRESTFSAARKITQAAIEAGLLFDKKGNLK